MGLQEDGKPFCPLLREPEEGSSFKLSEHPPHTVPARTLRPPPSAPQFTVPFECMLNRSVTENHFHWQLQKYEGQG